MKNKSLRIPLLTDEQSAELYKRLGLEPRVRRKKNKKPKAKEA